MSLNKQQLEVVNQTNFPDNNTKYITPALLRDFNTDMIDAIQLTGSYATTGSNTFVGNQIITGNLNVSGVISASVLYVQTETASVIYSSGSNQFGDELTDTQTLSGSVKVQGSLTVNGTAVLTSSADVTGFVTTASFNAYTQSNDQRVSSLETNSGSVNISITNVNSATASLFTSVNSLNSFTQSQAVLNGQFATTGSNTFTGNQIIDRASKLYTNGIYWTDVTAGFNNLEIINQGGGNLDFASLNGGRMRVVNTPLILTGSALSSSNDISTSANIYAANLTGSTLPSGLLSSSVTNFTNYSASVDSRINSITGSTINTGSFATTGSNAFIGNQTISGSLLVSGSSAIGFSGSAFRVDTTGAILFKPGTDITFQGNTTFTNPIRTTFINVDNSGSSGFYGFNNEVDGRMYQNFSSSLDTRINNIVTGTGFATTGSNTFTGNQNIQGTLTASLADGFTYVGNSSNISTLVATSSFGTSINTGSFATTGSNTFTGNQTISTAGNTQLTLTASAGFQTNIEFRSENSNFQAYGDFRVNNNGQFGGSGSIKFTTSRNFMELAADSGTKIGATNGGGNGIDAGNISMQVRSGSLSLAPSGISNTTSSLSHLSSSSNTTFVNLMFKNSDVTADTIISGSNNIFTNPGAVTAGFKRYIGGSQNYFGSTLPQITGSAAFSPSINNNILATGMLMRIPVSSSAYTMNGNVLMNPAANGIQLGTAAATNFEKAVSGLTFTNNVINGTVFATAYKTPLSASVSITTNVIAGAVIMNLDSSSFTLAQNNINGTFTVNNSYFPGTVTAASATVSAATNIIGGTLTLYTSGSNTTFTGAPRSYQNSLSSGGGNVISASLNGDNSSVNSNNLLGQALLVYGNNSRPAGATAADWGSAYVGRWNAVNNNRAFTADTVFAVGTGRSEATRKTGFLIDSGSNSFIEGTLNISGSTTMTGSLTIQSGSGFFANGNRQFNVGAFSSLVSQSGSANVSQSMNFEVTDIASGVSIASNSRITLANAGTYNIQFSAQVVAAAGADNLYIWLKKNGTNVAASAGHLDLANNAEAIAAWNYVVDAAAADYFEIAWQATDAGTIILAETATGNIPSVPSVILTVTQVR
jgi:hypothetical protein